jgi:hypothetical protein
VRARPAESLSVAGAVAILAARLLGVDDPDTIVAMAVVVGAMPAGFTWLVELLRRK